MTISAKDAADHAETLLTARSNGQQVTPISASNPEFSLADAEAVADRILALRVAQGEVAVGRKIGFTNRALWPAYNVNSPIWGDMFDTTVHDLAAAQTTVTLPPLTEPKIEPEIVFGMGKTPEDPDMPLAELAACIDWVAHGFEVVTSVYPGWKQTAADAHAAFGMHGALYIGPRVALADLSPDPVAALAGVHLTLSNSTGTTATGAGTGVLDGPVNALSFLLKSLETLKSNSVVAGDIITTGTLTDAFPLKPGERWTTTIEGAPLSGLDVTFTL